MTVIIATVQANINVTDSVIGHYNRGITKNVIESVHWNSLKPTQEYTSFSNNIHSYSLAFSMRIHICTLKNIPVAYSDNSFLAQLFGGNLTNKSAVIRNIFAIIHIL